jgi:hypothetical protein
MIHCTVIAANDPNAPEDHSLLIWVTGRTELLKLQALLNRSLNCAPEFGADWFALSDRLDQFLTEQGISRTEKES